MMRWTLTSILVLLALAAGWYAGHRAPAAAAATAEAPPPAAAAPAAADAQPDLVPAGKGFNPDFVKTALPQRQTVAQGIPVTGKLSLDKQQVRIAAARVAGRLGRIFVFEGQSVKAGEALAEIYSPDYISAENELLLARRFRDTLAGGGEAGLRDDAAATYAAAVSRLKVLGAAPADIAALEKSGKIEEYLMVRAPIGGVVTQRNVDPGGYLNIGDTLMTLANTDTLWLTFNTYDRDYAALKLGQELRFSTSSLPGETFSGRVAFIAPAVDPATHTLPVRCDIPNPGMRLRPEMFVSGQLNTGEAQAWVVPRSAVFRIREQDYVFVQDGGHGYRRTPVSGRALDGGQYAVSAGLPEGQPVVVEGAVLLNQMAGQ
jgi:Cu(I)/Ag(I) efflux system membrane fusion protein